MLSIIEKFGAAYMMADESVEKALIILTERGYNELYLKIIVHQQPIPVEEPKLIQIEDLLCL